ncbi:MAG: DUF1254 domain-containing protein [Alphaproteobacteria bacterium]
MRGSGLWWAIALLLAGVVHITAILVIPTLAPRSGFSRYEASLQANRAIVVAPARPGKMPFPFASPDVLYVLCRFDVSENPVRFSAPGHFVYWSVAVYEPDGGNYVNLNAIQAGAQDVEVVVLGQGQERDEGDDATIANATHPRGLIILRMFLRDRSLATSLTQVVQSARCESIEPI